MRAGIFMHIIILYFLKHLDIACEFLCMTEPSGSLRYSKMLSAAVNFATKEGMPDACP